MAKDVNERSDAQGTSAQSTGGGSESVPVQQEGSRGQGLQGSGVQGGQQPGGSMQRRSGQGLARYGRSPFAMMQQLSDEMDRLFDSVFYGAPARGAAGARESGMPTLWSPDIEVSTEGNQLRVCVDLPGIPKDSVKVDINQGMLTIEGERREEQTEGGEKQGFRRTERRYGSFHRTIALPEGVNAEQAQARMKDGVLEITLPMNEQAKGRSLPIQD